MSTNQSYHKPTFSLRLGKHGISLFQCAVGNCFQEQTESVLGSRRESEVCICTVVFRHIQRINDCKKAQANIISNKLQVGLRLGCGLLNMEQQRLGPWEAFALVYCRLSQTRFCRENNLSENILMLSADKSVGYTYVLKNKFRILLLKNKLRYFRWYAKKSFAEVYPVIGESAEELHSAKFRVLPTIAFINKRKYFNLFMCLLIGTSRRTDWVVSKIVPIL